MLRVESLAATILLTILVLGLAACGNDPAAPPAPPSGNGDLDVAAVLADYASGEIDGYAAALHPDFRFVTGADDSAPYVRVQELVLLQAMHGGQPGTGGEILQGVELVRCEPVGDWLATDRDDPLGADRPGARKRSFSLTLRFAIAGVTSPWDVDGQVTAYADAVDGTPRLLGLVDRTGDPSRGDAPSWLEVRRTWAEPEPPELPGSPDLLSMRWIAAHDGRDWLLMGDLLHPAFRYLGPDGEQGDRAAELALFADLMAGRPSRGDARVAQLDARNWEHTEGPWSAVGSDDPHFGDVPGAVAQWLDIRIVYTTEGGETWDVDGLVRMGAVETPQGWQLLGFVDDTAETGEPGSIGWAEVRARFRWSDAPLRSDPGHGPSRFGLHGSVRWPTMVG